VEKFVVFLSTNCNEDQLHAGLFCAIINGKYRGNFHQNLFSIFCNKIAFRCCLDDVSYEEACRWYVNDMRGNVWVVAES